MSIPTYHYDNIRGWEKTHPKWYEVKIRLGTLSHYNMEKYNEIVEWIAQNIDGYVKHTRFILGMYDHEEEEAVLGVFRFRNKKDYMWFKLIWQ